MTGLDIFNIIVGTLGIISFVFSIWIWMRSDTKIHELSGIISTVYDISEAALWEFQATITKDPESRFGQIEKTLGFVSSIRKLTEHYDTKVVKSNPSNPLDQLIERGIIMTQAIIWELEASKEVTDVWVVTPDLKPDCSDETIGKLVNQNIKGGKKYIYFYPDDLPHVNNEVSRLLKNIGVDPRSHKLMEKVTLVPLCRTKHTQLFNGGNVILYYCDEKRSIPPRCFEEIVLTRLSQRGSYWQEHSESKSNEFRHTLESELQSLGTNSQDNRT